MPDNAAALVELTVFGSGLTRLQLLDSFLRRTKLLVARHHLDGLATRLAKQGKVTNNIEKVLFA